jgi:beta-glucosidase
MGGSGRVLSDAAVSIRRGLEARGGFALRVSPTDSVGNALQAARGADVVVACGGATSTESLDRPHLRLDAHGFLVELGRRLRATSAGARFVVVALAPGAVLTDWAAHADAAALGFLAGEQTGHAWADVLAGGQSPTGRLPVTLPLTEADTVPPCQALSCDYTEGLFVGWRGLQDTAVAFPFGHGLAYTTFTMAWTQTPALSADPPALVRMRVSVTNAGAVAGAEVAQLYVRFPSDAGEPTLVLRGFARTRLLQPGAAEEVAFALTARDVSTWREGWRRAHGEFVVHVGASSRDLRVQQTIVL